MIKKYDRKTVTSLLKQAVAGIVLLGIISGITVLLSSAQMPLPERESELIISFKAEGAPVYTEEQENDELPRHMQRKGEPRVERRSDVAVQVTIAENILFEDQFRPKGIFRRGYSSGIINIPLDPGFHTLDVKIGDYINDEFIWNHTQQRQIEIEKGERVVLKYTDQQGFRWYSKEN